MTRIRTSLFALSSLALASLASVACSSDSASNTTSAPLIITASGEALGQEGFDFPGAADEPSFGDGWAVKFEHFYAGIADVTLSRDPDKNPKDQSVYGADVAELAGPWIVDLTPGGPVKGKSGEGTVELGRIPNLNLAGNSAFSTTEKYALGYSFAVPTDAATKVSVGANDANVAEMKAKKYAILYVGTATFKGDSSCAPAADDAALKDLPKVVHFKFGYTATPHFENCQNPDLGEAEDGSPRGIQFKESGDTVAQLTVHGDHPFWNSNKEDAPLAFDALAYAALVKGKGTAENPLLLEDLAGVPFAPVRLNGKGIPTRVCGGAPNASELSYDPNGGTFADLKAFMEHLQESQGHLNADGLCAGHSH